MSAGCWLVGFGGQSLTTQSALSITLKTSLNLQELNLFREKHYSTVDHRCNEGEAVVYNHYIGQMTHTELKFYFRQLWILKSLPENNHVMNFISFIFPQFFLDVIIDNVYKDSTNHSSGTTGSKFTFSKPTAINGCGKLNFRIIQIFWSVKNQQTCKNNRISNVSMHTNL